MGRKPTVNLSLPPGMRKRVRKYGTYYFLDTGAKPRVEIPLGPDYILALKQYAQMHQAQPVAGPVFDDIITRYEVEVLPSLRPNTIRVQKSDIKHLRAFFHDAPLEEIEPSHLEKFKRKHHDKPTTANRCMRLFSAMWNHARGWGYTSLPNPKTGIKGYKLDKRTVYVTDQVLQLVYDEASEPLRDALDLAYLAAQRPADTLSLTEHHIVDGCLQVKGQDKTGKPLRIRIEGRLADVIERIRTRKKRYKIVSTALLVNEHGKRLTAAVLRNHFVEAREAAANKHPAVAEDIRTMWFYDLRAKAADDTADHSGDQAASDLLGHETVVTTKRHYLRRGKIVGPVK